MNQSVSIALAMSCSNRSPPAKLKSGKTEIIKAWCYNGTMMAPERRISILSMKRCLRI